MSYIDDMIDLQNVKPGNVAVLKLSYNATFDKVHLFLGGGLTKADITRIEGKANGVTFYVDSGPKLAQRDAYEGIFSDTSIVTLDFTEPHARGGAAPQYLASIPRNALASLTFEITLGSGANANSTLRAKAEYRGPTKNTMIMRRKDFNAPLAITGDNDLVLPAAVNGGLIKRIWLHHGGNVTKAELRLDGVPRMRTLDADMQYMQKRNGITPQTDLMVLDFIADGNLMGLLNTQNATEVLLRITTSAADTIAAYIDYIDDLSRLK